MKYFAAIVVLAAMAYARPEGDANSGRDAREAIALAYPGAYPGAYAAYPGSYVAGAPVAYASQPAYAAAPAVAAPVAYAAPAYKAYAAPQYAHGAPIAYAAHPSYYNAYKTVHV